MDEDQRKIQEIKRSVPQTNRLNKKDIAKTIYGRSVLSRLRSLLGIEGAPPIFYASALRTNFFY